MKLEKALELVLNEAESSALGECSSQGNKVLEAVELIQKFYEEYGHHFKELDNKDKPQDDFSERMMKLLKERWDKTRKGN